MLAQKLFFPAECFELCLFSTMYIYVHGAKRGKESSMTGIKWPHKVHEQPGSSKLVQD